MVTVGFLQEMSNPDAGCGLVRYFPELCLLPDLLRTCSASSDLLRDRRRMLSDSGYNQDHIEDEFVPSDMRSRNTWRWVRCAFAAG